MAQRKNKNANSNSNGNGDNIDEFINAIRQLSSLKNSIDPNEQMAMQLKNIMDAFMRNGFTRDEAFELLTLILSLGFMGGING